MQPRTRGRQRARERREGRRRSHNWTDGLDLVRLWVPGLGTHSILGLGGSLGQRKRGSHPFARARGGSLRSRRFLRCSPERRHCLGEQRREVVESLGCPFAPRDSLSRTCSGGGGGRSYGEAGEGLAWVPPVTFLYPGERLGWGQRRSSHSSQGCQLRRGTTRCRRILC